jgi:hypothetical protein
MTGGGDAFVYMDELIALGAETELFGVFQLAVVRLKWGTLSRVRVRVAAGCGKLVLPRLHVTTS